MQTIRFSRRHILPLLAVLIFIVLFLFANGIHAAGATLNSWWTGIHGKH